MTDRPPEPVSISSPRLVCVSSPQFLELGFQNQIQMVLDALPKHVQHEQALNSSALRKTLAQGDRFDIVHIATYVCPRSGDLYFSEVDPRTGESQAEPADVMTAEELSSLLKKTGTRLVVIGGCDSLVLINNLLSVTNVISPRDLVSPQAMALWVATFYTALETKPLAAAVADAARASRVPMMLYGQQPNVIFQSHNADAAPAFTDR